MLIAGDEQVATGAQSGNAQQVLHPVHELVRRALFVLVDVDLLDHDLAARAGMIEMNEQLVLLRLIVARVFASTAGALSAAEMTFS